MEKRITYFVSRKNLLTWLATILLACSVAARIAYFCGEKGAEDATVWMGLLLPAAACVLYGLAIHLGGKERVYRSVIPFAMYCAYIAWNACLSLESGWFSAVLWVAMLVIAVIYNVVFVGKIRHNWILVLILLVLSGTQVYMTATAEGTNVLVWSMKAWANITASLAILCTVLAMQPHLDGAYHPTWGDRPDGRRVRTIPPITMVTPYIMPNRTGASNNIHSSVEITEMEKYIRMKKREEGLQNFGVTHVLLAAYVRCVAMYPAMNRFLSGQRVYSRGRDIQFSMTIKKEMTTDAPDTCIKLHLDPADTVYDIYKKLNDAVVEVKNTPLNNDMDQVARALSFIPGVMLKFVVWCLKTMDYFGFLPRFLLEVSPFHGSVYFTSMGSLGIPPIVHHLYDFGNIPAFCAFGCKRKAYELNAEGEVVQKKYIDFTFNLDERTVDGFYYATVLKTFNRLLQHPERLDVPPENVLMDVD